ncbi:hypothetical protein C8Q74DRAFT_984418 [Fomes fomentarius]|nr:hypothetical protein C8Q74DRAFT_984418 [Fomes fomentarius]
MDGGDEQKTVDTERRGRTYMQAACRASKGALAAKFGREERSVARPLAHTAQAGRSGSAVEMQKTKSRREGSAQVARTGRRGGEEDEERRRGKRGRKRRLSEMVKCRVMGGANRRWSSRGCASFHHPAARRTPPCPDDEQLEEEEKQPWYVQTVQVVGESRDEEARRATTAFRSSRAFGSTTHPFPRPGRPSSLYCSAYSNSSMCRFTPSLLKYSPARKKLPLDRQTCSEISVSWVGCSTPDTFAQPHNLY